MKYKLLLVIMLAAVLTVPAVSASDDLVIIHTNDVHARYADNLGYAAAADIVDEFREKYENVLLIDAGDTLNGKPEAGSTEGASAVEILNAMGYDAMTTGNHDYDYGLDILLERESEMNFPLLVANVFYKDSGEPVFQDNAIIEKGDWKIGIFGLVTPNTVTTSTFGKLLPVDFASGDELYAIAQENVDELKEEGCNIIICISHLGMDDIDYPDTSIELLKNVDGIDLCIDGHSHTTLEHGYETDNSIIVSTGCYLDAVGVVTVTPDKKITAELIESHEGVDENINELVTEFINESADEYNVVIGYSEVYLDGNRNPGVRTEETNLGDFASDALYYYAEEKGYDADIGLINGGGLRISIPVGDITVYDLMTLEPFGNTLVIMSADGKTLLQAIEDNTATNPGESGGFPHVSGMTYSIDTSKNYTVGEINRVKILSIGGEKFDENKIYNIATNNFIANGGDLYAEFSDMEIIWDPKITISDIYQNYINKTLNGVIGEEYAYSQNRILIDSESVKVNLFSGILPGSYSFVEISKLIVNLLSVNA